MEFWEIFITVFTTWNIVGCIIWVSASALIGDDFNGAFSTAKGMEWVNPLVIYKKNHVNWFGAFFVAFLYNLIFPAGSIVYWMYKICTVGRK